MYNQLIYFIVALLLFAIQDPGDEPFFTPWESILSGLSFFLLYAVICRAAFRRLQKAFSEDLPSAALMSAYLATQRRLSILALLSLAVDVFVLSIKYYLQAFPGFQQSLTLPGILGLMLLLIHLSVMWFYSYPIYQRIHRSTMKPAAFLRGNLAFSSGILVPWFLISILSDLLQIPGAPAFLKSDAGQFLAMGGLLVIFVLFAPRLVIRLWGCRALPITPERRELESFAQENRFTVGNFMLWPLFGGETLTAGIIGMLPKWRYILITRGLLGILNVEELKAVFAHEMGHVRRYHLLLYLAFFICYSLLAYSLNDLALLLLLRNAVLSDWLLSFGSSNATLLSAVTGIPMILMLVLYFRYVFGYFMRNSERQADLYALQVMGHPFLLVSSLRKIAYHSGQSEDIPSWHHYSIRQRIDFLLRAYENPALVRKHHTKYYTAILLFFLLVAGLTSAGFSLERSKVVRNWRTDLQIAAIEREIDRIHGDHRLYSAYGSLLLERRRFGEAEAMLRKSLKKESGNASVLNNLAWLYATSPPPYFKPEAALDLALRAAAIEPEPTILDTLAEAYYVNGRVEEALDTIEHALVKQPPNPDYFLNQKKKFEIALRQKQEGK